MPEGHKTHFLASQHTTWLGRQKLKITSPQGRFRADARKINGKVFDHVSATGKHLFYHFDSGHVVHVHLGRYGSFADQASPPQPPRGQVRMRMVGKSQTLDLRGPTRCEVISTDQVQAIQSRLGPDPLGGGKKQDVWKNIHSSHRPIGALLLDQSVIAGIGNIFRAEILFEIGMNPNRPGNRITSEQFAILWKSLTKMMKTSLKYGRIISVTSKEAGKPLAKLDNQQRFRVYGIDQCPRCRGPIQADSIASRKLYWCPNCQTD